MHKVLWLNIKPRYNTLYPITRTTNITTPRLHHISDATIHNLANDSQHQRQHNACCDTIHHSFVPGVSHTTHGLYIRTDATPSHASSVTPIWPKCQTRHTRTPHKPTALHLHISHTTTPHDIISTHDTQQSTPHNPTLCTHATRPDGAAPIHAVLHQHTPCRSHHHTTLYHTTRWHPKSQRPTPHNTTPSPDANFIRFGIIRIKKEICL